MIRLDLNTGSLIVSFGQGTIAVGAGNVMDDDGFLYLRMEELKTPLQIGEAVPLEKKPDGPYIYLKFNKVESVDVVIKSLNKIRDGLVLSEKASQIMAAHDDAMKKNPPTSCHLCGAKPDKDGDCECN